MWYILRLVMLPIVVTGLGIGATDKLYFSIQVYDTIVSKELLLGRSCHSGGVLLGCSDSILGTYNAFSATFATFATHL